MKALTDFIKKLWGMEIIRYLFAGGTAFVFDKLASFATDRFLLPETVGVEMRDAISVLVGFLIGLLINNLVSMYLVFTSEKQKKNSRTAGAFAAFSAVGIIGLLLTVGGNQLFIRLFGEGDAFRRLLYNVIVAVPVLIWNYFGRRAFANRGTNANANAKGKAEKEE